MGNIQIIFNHNLREKYIGWKLNKDYGIEVIENPVIVNPQGYKKSDYDLNGNEPFELKSPREALRFKWGKQNPFADLIKDKLDQSDTFIFDITTNRTTKELAVNWVNDIFKKNDKFKKVKRCLIMANGRNYKMLARK